MFHYCSGRKCNFCQTTSSRLQRFLSSFGLTLRRGHLLKQWSSRTRLRRRCIRIFAIFSCSVSPGAPCICKWLEDGKCQGWGGEYGCGHCAGGGEDDGHWPSLQVTQIQIWSTSGCRWRASLARSSTTTSSWWGWIWTSGALQWLNSMLCMKQKDHHSRRENLKENRMPCGKFDTTVANERRDIFKKSLGDFAEKLVPLTELPAKPELVKVT